MPLTQSKYSKDSYFYFHYFAAYFSLQFKIYFTSIFVFGKCFDSIKNSIQQPKAMFNRRFMRYTSICSNPIFSSSTVFAKLIQNQMRLASNFIILIQMISIFFFLLLLVNKIDYVESFSNQI